MSSATGFLSQYPSMISYPSCGVSEEFGEIAATARDFYQYIAEASVAYGQLNQLQKAIDDAAAVAIEANWDGEDAMPVNRRTLALSRRFASALPSDIKVPDVYAESRGEMTFEWRAGKSRIVSVSVYPNGTIGYASLIGTSKAYGNESFVSTLPSALVQRIAKVYA